MSKLSSWLRQATGVSLTDANAISTQVGGTVLGALAGNPQIGSAIGNLAAQATLATQGGSPMEREAQRAAQDAARRLAGQPQISAPGDGGTTSTETTDLAESVQLRQDLQNPSGPVSGPPAPTIGNGFQIDGKMIAIAAAGVAAIVVLAIVLRK